MTDATSPNLQILSDALKQAIGFAVQGQQQAVGGFQAWMQQLAASWQQAPPQAFTDLANQFQNWIGHYEAFRPAAQELARLGNGDALTMLDAVVSDSKAAMQTYQTIASQGVQQAHAMNQQLWQSNQDVVKIMQATNQQSWDSFNQISQQFRGLL